MIIFASFGRYLDGIKGKSNVVWIQNVRPTDKGWLRSETGAVAQPSAFFTNRTEIRHYQSFPTGKPSFGTMARARMFRSTPVETFLTLPSIMTTCKPDAVNACNRRGLHRRIEGCLLYTS
ncbi:MAG: hypothetical protein N2255_03490, partial [Kiritimatiellae bacterium]|nr:hypothetical protein [Kiritimatiellia bacterium]